MPDEGLRFEAWTMPHVGALTRKFDFSKWVEQYTLNDRFNDLCDGTLSMPDDYPLKASLFHIDEANHANDVGSMIRVSRGTTPIMHYLVTRSEDSWSDGEPTHKLALEGLEWILDRVLVPNYDHPADPAKEPDWIYGAPSILENTDFEAAGATNLLIHLWIEDTVTSGTWTITFPGQTTGALAWNIDITALQTAIEGLSNIQDIIISGDGTATNPWAIEIVDPAETDFNVSVNSAGLTGGVALMLSMVAGGAGITDPWTRSFNPLTQLNHGTYTNFDTSTTEAHTGTTSLYVKGAIGPWPESFPGAQQIISVTGGRTYRAKVWIYPKFAANYRFVIRSTDETWIGSVEAALTANSWQEMAFSVLIPDHIQSIIFRVACISTGAVHEFYMDDALLAPGQDAATLGKMVDDVRTAGIAVGSPLAWLVPTWSPTLDSDGAAWDSTRMWNVNHGQSFYQLIEYCRRWNYESRLRWDVADNRFEWDMWNPLAGGQVRANIAITGKSGVTGSAPIVKRPPNATYVKTEGAAVKGGLPWGEFASTTLDDVWGRLEKFHQDRQGVDSTELDELAERIITKNSDNTAARAITVGDPSLLPWTSYEPGDTVTLNLAPKDVKKVLRVAAIVASKSPNDAAPKYDVHFGAPVYSNDTAIAAGLRTLIREFRRPTPTSLDGTPVPPRIGGGSAPTLVIACADSSQFSKDRADYILQGVNDHLLIQQAATSLTSTFGTIWLCEGNANIATVGGQASIKLPFGVSLRGLGKEVAYILVDSHSGAGAATMVESSGGGYIRDLAFWNTTSSDITAIELKTGFGNLDVESVRFDCDGKAIWGTGSNANVAVSHIIYSNGDINGAEPAILIINGSRWTIHDSEFFAGRNAIRGESDCGAITIHDNYGEEIAEEAVCFVPGAGTYSVEALKSHHNTWLGGGFNGTFSGMYIEGTPPRAVTGLSVDTDHDTYEAYSKYGVEFVGVAHGSIKDVLVEESARHGIHLTDSSDCQLHGNKLWECGQETDNTYDGIFLAGSSDDVDIQFNKFLKHGTTPRTRYCVNVSVSTCDRTVVVSNQMRDGYQTAAINNAGTGTIITYPGGGAGIGDNFV